MYFKVKTQERRHFVGCLTVVTQIRKWRLIACVVMVTSWRLFAMQINACHPLKLKPYGYVQKISNAVVHLSIYDIFVSGILWCVRSYAHKSWLTFNEWLGHLIGSVNCDVTGPLWRHQKAVSCLGWDKSISDTRRLSRTPRCTRQVIISWCWWNFLTSANQIVQIGSCDRSRIHVPDLGGMGVWPGKNGFHKKCKIWMILL